jgi:hypothetical protein
MPLYFGKIAFCIFDSFDGGVACGHDDRLDGPGVVAELRLELVDACLEVGDPLLQGPDLAAVVFADVVLPASVSAC